MPRETFCVYNRQDLKNRLKALGPKIRAQGGLPEAGEYPTLTEILLELARMGEWLMEQERYSDVLNPPRPH